MPPVMKTHLLAYWGNSMEFPMFVAMIEGEYVEVFPKVQEANSTHTIVEFWEGGILEGETTFPSPVTLHTLRQYLFNEIPEYEVYFPKEYFP